jgi:hypothetical protein
MTFAIEGTFHIAVLSLGGILLIGGIIWWADSDRHYLDTDGPKAVMYIGLFFLLLGLLLCTGIDQQAAGIWLAAGLAGLVTSVLIAIKSDGDQGAAFAERCIWISVVISVIGGLNVSPWG